MFKDGAPRKGQWVKLTRELLLGSEPEPAGTVGICTGPVEGGYAVTLVTFPAGENRKRIVAGLADLAPVLTREELPQDRLATYDPDWVPQA